MFAKVFDMCDEDSVNLQLSLTFSVFLDQCRDDVWRLKYALIVATMKILCVTFAHLQCGALFVKKNWMLSWNTACVNNWLMLNWGGGVDVNLDTVAVVIKEHDVIFCSYDGSYWMIRDKLLVMWQP